MNLRLEQYIKEVDSHLKSLPKQEREQTLAEMRQHLASLIAMGRSYGDSEEQATNNALAQFGSATAFQQQIRTAHRKRLWQSFRSSWAGALLITFVVWFAVAFSGAALNPLLERLATTDRQAIFLGYVAITAQFALVGWLAARFSGRRCLPVLLVLLTAFYSIYIAPQLRHADMPIFLRWQTLGSFISFACASLVAAWAALRRDKSTTKTTIGIA